MARLEKDSREDYHFNQQAMLATSDAANAGINNKDSHGAFRFEFSLFIEYYVQEKGRSRRRLGENSKTVRHTTHLSLHTFF